MDINSKTKIQGDADAYPGQETPVFVPLPPEAEAGRNFEKEQAEKPSRSEGDIERNPSETRPMSEKEFAKKEGVIASFTTTASEGSSKVEMTPAQLRAFKWEGYRVVLGGICLHLVLGTFYLWGSVSLYVASFLKHYNDSIDINLVKLVFPFMKIATNITMPIGVRLAHRFGVRRVALSGTALSVISVFATSYITNFAGMLIVYGILFGFASGIIFVIPIEAAWKYFPHKKGVTNGLIVGAFGMGTFIFNYVALAVVNPDNEKASVVADGTKYFTEDVYSKVPAMFRVLAGCYLGLGVLGSSLLASPSVTPSNYPDVSTNNNSGQIQKARPQIETLGEGLRSRAFWWLLIITTLTAFYGFMLANNYKVYGMITIGDDLYLTTVGSVGSAVKGVARFIWAALADRFGFKKIFMILLAMMAAVCGSFITISHSKPLFMIWYIISMGTEEAAIMPTITAKVFGSKKSGLIYPFVYIGFSLANLGSFFITYGTLSWSAVFWTCFALIIVCMAFVLTFNENPTFVGSKDKNKSKLEPESESEPESVKN